VSPIENNIEVRVKEFDLYSTAVVGTTFEEVCEDVSNGQNLEFTTKHGTFTFVLDKKGVLDVDQVSDYLVSEWPGSPSVFFTHLLEHVGADPKYRILPDSLADTIWNDSGLESMSWTENVFDCDDFATVYKAAALKAGYTDGNDYNYAVWMIWGVDPDLGGHMTNVYINEYMQVKVLEPQNGRVVFGKDWDFTPLLVLLL
jgi:hypothetical protein